MGNNLDTNGNVTGGTPDDFSAGSDLSSDGTVDTLSGWRTPSGVTLTSIVGDNLSILWGQLNASTSGGSTSLTSGGGISPGNITDGTELTVAWGDADGLDSEGLPTDFRKASVLDNVGAINSWAGASHFNGAGKVTRRAISYDPGIIEWTTTNQPNEMYRLSVGSEETFVIERVEFLQQGGGGSQDAAIDVRTNGSSLVKQTIGRTTRPTDASVSSTTAVMIELTNDTGFSISANPRVLGYIEG